MSPNVSPAQKQLPGALTVKISYQTLLHLCSKRVMLHANLTEFGIFFLHGTGLVGTKVRRLKESYNHYIPIQKTTETR